MVKGWTREERFYSASALRGKLEQRAFRLLLSWSLYLENLNGPSAYCLVEVYIWSAYDFSVIFFSICSKYLKKWVIRHFTHRVTACESAGLVIARPVLIRRSEHPFLLSWVIKPHSSLKFLIWNNSPIIAPNPDSECLSFIIRYKPIPWVIGLLNNVLEKINWWFSEDTGHLTFLRQSSFCCIFIIQWFMSIYTRLL